MYSRNQNCAMSTPRMIPPTIEMKRPIANGHMLAMKAFGSSPFAVIAQAALKIADGYVMKSGLMSRAAHSQ
jgi:hypothetical protein